MRYAARQRIFAFHSIFAFPSFSSLPFGETPNSASHFGQIHILLLRKQPSKSHIDCSTLCPLLFSLSLLSLCINCVVLLNQPWWKNPLEHYPLQFGVLCLKLIAAALFWPFTMTVSIINTCNMINVLEKQMNTDQWSTDSLHRCGLCFDLPLW